MVTLKTNLNAGAWMGVRALVVGGRALWSVLRMESTACGDVKVGGSCAGLSWAAYYIGFSVVLPGVSALPWKKSFLCFWFCFLSFLACFYGKQVRLYVRRSQCRYPLSLLRTASKEHQIIAFQLESKMKHFSKPRGWGTRKSECASQDDKNPIICPKSPLLLWDACNPP